MANTYQYINSSVLSSGASSVVFSSIPSTFDDLVLFISVRNTTSGSQNYFLKINSTAADYGVVILYGDGSSASSATYSSESSGYRVFQAQPGSDYVANTFSSTEIYIPKYKNTTAKIVAMHNAIENTNPTAYQSFVTGYQPATAAITSLEVTTAGNFAANSSFYLYGIKNS